MQQMQLLQYNRIYQKLVNPLTNERLIINASYYENKLCFLCFWWTAVDYPILFWTSWWETNKIGVSNPFKREPRAESWDGGSPCLAHHLDQVLDDLVPLPPVDVYQHVPSIVEIAAHEGRGRHVLQGEHLHLGVLELDLRDVPEHKVPVWIKVYTLYSLYKPHISSNSPSSLVMIAVCVVVHAEDAHLVLEHQFASI